MGYTKIGYTKMGYAKMGYTKMGCAKMATLEIHHIQNWTDNSEYSFAEVYWLID